ncbi:MAG: aldo/keto reductase [Actinomycetota bacterium]|nr:aldo/keto reductase [Actinomycetota bacterium]
MEYRPIGKNGPDVSVIAFGCGPSAGLMVNGSASEQDAAVGLAIDLGVTVFDTASVYGAGASEENLGGSLRRLSNGDRALIATKFLVDWDGLADPGASVTRSIRESLDRIGRDRLDVIQMHNRVALDPPEGAAFAIGPMLSVSQVLGDGGVADALEAAAAEGLVGGAGFTTFGGEVAAIEQLIDSGRFQMINGEFNMLNPTAVSTPAEAGVEPDYGGVMARAHDRGMGVAVIRALVGGALVDPEQGVHPLALARTQNPEHGPNVALAALVREAHIGDARPLEHIAIDFVLSHEQISTAVLGFSSAAQVERSIAALAK